jgi:hypothetical protein
MQHAAFGVHLVEFDPASFRDAQPCRNIRSNKHRSRTSFLLPLVASINRSTSRLVRCFRSLTSITPRQCSPFFRFCVRLSFCREFSLWDAPETRMNRGGDFSNIYKRDHFVEGADRRFLLGNVVSCIAAILFAFP